MGLLSRIASEIAIICLTVKKAKSAVKDNELAIQRM